MPIQIRDIIIIIKKIENIILGLRDPYDQDVEDYQELVLMLAESYWLLVYILKFFHLPTKKNRKSKQREIGMLRNILIEFREKYYH